MSQLISPLIISCSSPCLVSLMASSSVIVSFSLSMFFDPAPEYGKTDFHVEFSAELNFMMKMVLGSKLKEALDKMVTSLADASEGKMPEGFDPSQYGFGK